MSCYHSVTSNGLTREIITYQLKHNLTFLKSDVTSHNFHTKASLIIIPITVSDDDHEQSTITKHNYSHELELLLYQK